MFDFNSRGGQGKNPAPGVIATIVAWKCTEKEIFTLYGRFARGGGSKTSTHFLKTMQNVLKPLAKIQKKWDRNIHAKNSEVL